MAFVLVLSASLSASYEVETVAGLAGAYAHTDGVGTAARFKRPGMMSIDLSTGNLLEPDEDSNIRQITTAGGIYTVSTLFNYNVGSPPVQAVCTYITSDGTSSILTTDQYSHLYQWIESGGTYVYNTSLDAVSVTDAYDGYGLVIDSNNNIFMADAYEQVIYKILPNGSYSFFAGQAFSSGSADGTGSAAKFNGLTGITIDSSGNLYVSDTKNNTIRKITPAGVVTTIAGLAGSSGSSNGVGSAARFNSPWDIDIDAEGNLYVADRGNNLIRKLTNNGGIYTVSTIAGLAGSSGSSDGVGSAARFNAPTGLAVDRFGSIFVSDTNNSTIRRVFLPVLEIDFTNGAQLTAPITGGLKFAGTGDCTFLGSATAGIEINQGNIKVASAIPFGVWGVEMTGGSLEATAPMTFPALTLISDTTVKADTNNVHVATAGGSGELTLTGLDGSEVIYLDAIASAGGVNSAANPVHLSMLTNLHTNVGTFNALYLDSLPGSNVYGSGAVTASEVVVGVNIPAGAFPGTLTTQKIVLGSHSISQAVIAN